jgi:hypothetical protein
MLDLSNKFNDSFQRDFGQTKFFNLFVHNSSAVNSVLFDNKALLDQAGYHCL